MVVLAVSVAALVVPGWSGAPGFRSCAPGCQLATDNNITLITALRGPPKVNEESRLTANRAAADRTAKPILALGLNMLDFLVHMYNNVVVDLWKTEIF